MRCRNGADVYKGFVKGPALNKILIHIAVSVCFTHLRSRVVSTVVL